jgi:hypothetical protein
MKHIGGRINHEKNQSCSKIKVFAKEFVAKEFAKEKDRQPRNRL